MNFLLQILSNFLILIKELPLKSKVFILVLLIVLGCVVYSYVQYLEHDSEIERIRSDTQIRLAELSTAKPDSNNYKEDRNPKRVKRIVNKDTSSVAEIAYN